VVAMKFFTKNWSDNWSASLVDICQTHMIYLFIRSDLNHDRADVIVYYAAWTLLQIELVSVLLKTKMDEVVTSAWAFI